MTEPLPRSGYTASSLLSDHRDEVTDSLGQIVTSIARNGLLGQISGEFLARLRRQLAETTYGLLDLDLGHLFVAGWRTHVVLAAAARSTLDNPGAVEVVDLFRHSLSAVHQPSVDLVINEVRVATISYQIALTLDVNGLRGRVRHGRLEELEVGQCVGTVTLSCEGVELATASVELDPAVVVGLGTGLPLLHEAHRQPIPQPPALHPPTPHPPALHPPATQPTPQPPAPPAALHPPGLHPPATVDLPPTGTQPLARRL